MPHESKDSNETEIAVLKEWRKSTDEQIKELKKRIDFMIGAVLLAVLGGVLKMVIK